MFALLLVIGSINQNCPSGACGMQMQMQMARPMPGYTYILQPAPRYVYLPAPAPAPAPRVVPRPIDNPYASVRPKMVKTTVTKIVGCTGDCKCNTPGDCGHPNCDCKVTFTFHTDESFTFYKD